MVAPGNVNKHRTSMSGLKVQETEKWGRNTARERYGTLKQPDMTPADQSQPQKLGDRNNLQDPSYNNNTGRKDWILGFGKGGNETAENMPNFIPGYKGKR
jgi:hypothetical protein